MPIDTTLAHNNRVFVATYRGQITQEEVMWVIDRFVEVCNQATTLVHSINDSSMMIGIPVNIVGLSQSPTSPLRHPRRGKTIIVTNNEVLRATLNTASKVSPVDFYSVNTLDEAWRIMIQILENEDKNLNS